MIIFSLDPVHFSSPKDCVGALWARIIKNPDVSTGPLVRGKVNGSMAIFSEFFSILVQVHASVSKEFRILD